MDKITIEFDGKNSDSLKAHARCLKSDDLVNAIKVFMGERERHKNYVKALIGNINNKYDEDVLSKKFEAIEMVYNTFEGILEDYEINLDTI